MKTIHDIYRARLRLLVAEYGSQTALAAALDKPAAQISQWISTSPSSRQLSPSTARQIEKVLGKPAGWMDQPLDAAEGMPESLAELRQLIKDEVASIVELGKIQPIGGPGKKVFQVRGADFSREIIHGSDKGTSFFRGEHGGESVEQQAGSPAANVDHVESISRAAEDCLELPIGEAAKLIAKTALSKGFANGPMFTSATGGNDTINIAKLIANGNAGVLGSFDNLAPMFGVCLYKGKEALVVGPWVLSFDKLCEHGFLSELEAEQLKKAARKVARAMYRVACRGNEQAVATWRTCAFSQDAEAQS